MAWRAVLLYTEYEDSFDYFTPEQKALLPRTLEQWRAFVSGEAETPMVHEPHFIPMAFWSAFQGPKTPPPNINRYAMRAIEIHVASTSSQAFAYVKMGPAVAVGFIQPPPPDNWVGTQVALGDGQVAQRMGVPVSFIEYIMDRASKVLVSERERSARQRQKINQALEANLDRTAASETTRALEAYVQMFGVEQIFSPEHNPEG